MSSFCQLVSMLHLMSNMKCSRVTILSPFFRVPVGYRWCRHPRRRRRTHRRFINRVSSQAVQSQVLASDDIHRSVHIPFVPIDPELTPIYRVIAVVGFLDSIVAAKQNSARFGYSISPNRELVALGAANLAGSFVPGTLPAFGSITR